MKTNCAHCGIKANRLMKVDSKYSYLTGQWVCKKCVELFVKPEIRNYQGYLQRMQKRIKAVKATVHTDEHSGVTYHAMAR